METTQKDMESLKAAFSEDIITAMINARVKELMEKG
jgi:hypothetical protein